MEEEEEEEEEGEKKEAEGDWIPAAVFDLQSLWKGESWRAEEGAVKEKQKSKAAQLRSDPSK